MLEHTSQLAGAGTRTLLDRVLGPRPPPSPWGDTPPVREELFGVERLEQHAESLAAAQRIAQAADPRRAACTRGSMPMPACCSPPIAPARAKCEGGRAVVPAAEWLLDNYHLVEAQIREIRDDLPPGYYRQLPKLAEGPFRRLSRGCFGLAWAFVAHTDSHFDPETLRRFVVAYQRVQPLTIGELWAVAITLRIVLVENLRRLADQITAGRAARADADALADALLAPGGAPTALAADIATRAPRPARRGVRRRSSPSACATRTRGPRRRSTGWRSGCAARAAPSTRSSSTRSSARVRRTSRVRNVITSMRLISDIDWAEFFESVSLVDARLRRAAALPRWISPRRNLYRSAIEELARGSALSELEIAERALARRAAGGGRRR